MSKRTLDRSEAKTDLFDEGGFFKKSKLDPEHIPDISPVEEDLCRECNKFYLDCICISWSEESSEEIECPMCKAVFTK